LIYFAAKIHFLLRNNKKTPYFLGGTYKHFINFNKYTPI